MCGLDPRRTALDGTEMRACWTAAPAIAARRAAASWPGTGRRGGSAPRWRAGRGPERSFQSTSSAAGRRRLPASAERPARASDTRAGAGTSPRIPGAWWLWGDPEPWPDPAQGARPRPASRRAARHGRAVGSARLIGVPAALRPGRAWSMTVQVAGRVRAGRLRGDRAERTRRRPAVALHRDAAVVADVDRRRALASAWAAGRCRRRGGRRRGRGRATGGAGRRLGTHRHDVVHGRPGGHDDPGPGSADDRAGGHGRIVAVLLPDGEALGDDDLEAAASGILRTSGTATDVLPARHGELDPAPGDDRRTLHRVLGEDRVGVDVRPLLGARRIT